VKKINTYTSLSGEVELGSHIDLSYMHSFDSGLEHVADVMLRLNRCNNMCFKSKAMLSKEIHVCDIITTT
jgi:hypothetical protein